MYDSPIVTLPGKQRGSLIIVLHCHLPFIRDPRHEFFLEENWFYEAVTETYIPLLRVLGNLIDDGIRFRIAVSLSPTLIEMFNDSLLRRRCERHLESLIELSELELWRNRNDKAFLPAARMYFERFREVHRLYTAVYRRDLTAAFRSLCESGKVELITSSATHAYLPALMSVPSAAETQLRIAADHYRRTMGTEPSGLWLPECGFTPGIDVMAVRAGFRYFFLESHGLLCGNPPSRFGIYQPVATPAGAVVFARDVESSKQVWSAAEGYPGDFDYRDFYRDIGFDLEYGHIKPFLPGGTRTFTGLKYFRITGQTDQKEPYDPIRAQKKAEEHAGHFIMARKDQAERLLKKLKTEPVITAMYDAELFGHWWFEGPDWLDLMFRKGAGEPGIRFLTPVECFAGAGEMEMVTPSPSSWGFRGYSETWIDERNSWILRHLDRAGHYMAELAAAHVSARGLEERAINQCLRELLLSQASDWAFMMKSGNAADFARKKFHEHMGNFHALRKQILSGSVQAHHVAGLEERNNIFRDLDFRVVIGS